MRISDWSSDVCSSDLRLAQLRVAYDPFAPTVTLSRQGRQVVSGNPTDQTGRMLLSQFFAGFLAGSPRGTPSFHEADEGSREALLPNQVSLINLASIHDFERVARQPVDPRSWSRYSGMVVGSPVVMVRVPIGRAHV